MLTKHVIKIYTESRNLIGIYVKNPQWFWIRYEFDKTPQAKKPPIIIILGQNPPRFIYFHLSLDVILYFI